MIRDTKFKYDPQQTNNNNPSNLLITLCCTSTDKLSHVTFFLFCFHLLLRLQLIELVSEQIDNSTDFHHPLYTVVLHKMLSKTITLVSSRNFPRKNKIYKNWLQFGFIQGLWNASWFGSSCSWYVYYQDKHISW